jgi:uncharacterized protein (TIGR02145 family)
LVYPNFAEVGQTITITGSDFGSSQGISKISINNLITTNVRKWETTQIDLKVPEGATSGKLYVIVNSQKSNEVDFNVKPTDTSKAVTIGTQVWMRKNLDVNCYRNGDSIPQITDIMDWILTNKGAWCYYDNNSDNGEIYGKMYNWYAVNDPRGLAPVGWHIPSDNEWSTLNSFLGGSEIAGGKLKETGTVHWNPTNTCATDDFRFSALPGGLRTMSFSNKNYDGRWWTSSSYDSSNAFFYWTVVNNCYINTSHTYKTTGHSVRCVKD